MVQLNQGCYRIDWMGRPHMFVKCIACLHLDEDCRHLRTQTHLMLAHADETKGMEKYSWNLNQTA